MEEKRDNAGKIGLLWGLVLGAAFILSNVAGSWAGQVSPAVSGFFGAVSLLAQMGAPFAAGLLAARTHGGVGAGAFAGATAGTIGSLLLAVQLILLPGFMSPTLAALGVGNVEGASLCNVPIYAAIGGFFGIIGGFVGWVIYRQRHAAEKAARKAAARARWRQG